MPFKPEHINQYRHNKEFFENICDVYDSKYFDWKVTTLFYSILHHADVLLANKGYHPEDHKDRQTELNKILPKKEYRLYIRLKSASIDSRYRIKYLRKEAQGGFMDVYKKLYLPLETYFKENK